jgi:hypothetical protein
MDNETNENNEMKEKLKAAGQKAEEQKTQRHQRQVKGSHLLEALLSKAKAIPGLNSEDKTGFVKITGAAKGRSVYVAKKGGRVDISGYTVDAPAVKQITEAEAREKHLGKVRGMLDFDQSDEQVLAAYEAALTKLAEASATTETKEATPTTTAE